MNNWELKYSTFGLLAWFGASFSTMYCPLTQELVPIYTYYQIQKGSSPGTKKIKRTPSIIIYGI